MARTPTSSAPTPAAVLGRPARPPTALRCIAGGLRRPALVTVPRGELEELRIEVQVLRDEARELVRETLPAARRLEFYGRDHSPAAWQLAAGLVVRLSKYGRRFEPPEPKGAA